MGEQLKHKHNELSCLLSSADVLKASWSNSVDPDQSHLGPHFLSLHLRCTIYAADSKSRQHFQMHVFAGALKT